MKEIVEINGVKYHEKSVLQEHFGIGGSAWATLRRKGILPDPICLGHKRYYNLLDVESRMLTARDNWVETKGRKRKIRT